MKLLDSVKFSRYLQGAGIVLALALLISLALWQQLASDDIDLTTKNVYSPLTAYELDKTRTFVPLRIKSLPDQRKIALGEQLFNETRLSTVGISCATCHVLALGGGDGRKLGVTATGQNTLVNTPSIFNVGFNFRQGWRANIPNLEEQIDRVIDNPRQMNSSWPLIIDELSRDSEYEASFVDIYEQGITEETITDALVAYEISLVTPNSPFDKYLSGDSSALSEDQKAGFLLFREYGCQSCHQGVNLGGNMLARWGVFEDPFTERVYKTEVDKGLMSITGDEIDRAIFKVPGLRNVAKTAPYFHDGSIAQLEDAVDEMARYQLGRNLDGADIFLIAEFLRSLTGEYKGKPL